jgi:hypothetical protein
MHQLITNIHIWANVVFSIIAIVLFVETLKGYFYSRIYTKRIVYLENAYIGLLYFGLFLGIILYFFFHQHSIGPNVSMEELKRQQNSQFWAIEHFSVMVFSLMIAQIGKIFTVKAISDHNRYKYALFYYGIASLIIFVSMSIYLYYKFS